MSFCVALTVVPIVVRSGAEMFRSLALADLVAAEHPRPAVEAVLLDAPPTMYLLDAMDVRVRVLGEFEGEGLGLP